ncbi:MAG TPA: hypothetical protein VK991_10195 [Halomonas sp.]|nr:hypothetical protein [Halomonas sp.]
MMRGLFLAASIATGSISAQARAAEFVDHVGLVDKLLVAGGVIIVLLVTIYCIKCFVQPDERQARHIKRRILKDDGEDRP